MTPVRDDARGRRDRRPAAPTVAGLDPVMLVELQAAVRAGAGAGEAVAATCGRGPLAGVAQQVRLGQSLSVLADQIDTGDAGADALVRALALAERTGAAASEAVEHALEGIAAEAALQRTLDVRTAQARGTAVVLAAVPLAAWVLLVAVDRRTLAFYATPLGLISAVGAVTLAGAAWCWMRRMTAAARRAALLADPLTPQPVQPSWRRGAVAAMVAMALLGTVAAPVAGAMAGLAAGAVAARPRGLGSGREAAANAARGGGAADVVDLLAVGLAAGLAPATALAEVARMAPPAAAAAMHSAARRAAAGWTIEESFADGPLADLGRVLSACHRWGAPAAPALRSLAAELRSRRTAAAEVAAERLQLTLVFPTTLLTLPAFVLGVVPPLLWSTLQR